ncbi:MAG: D-alanyl-D-alanine carboxypeptidase [Bacteroidetes bacterium]|nr:D-alanyl-D-alanine carboxypeptidase [Bacteroidota bacterium]
MIRSLLLPVLSILLLSSCRTISPFLQQDATISHISFPENEHSGYLIFSGDGSLVDSLNQDRLFTPASLQKLLFLPDILKLKEDSVFLSVRFGFDPADSSLLIFSGGDPLLGSEEFAFSLIKAMETFPQAEKVRVYSLPYDTLAYWGKGWMYDDEPFDFQPWLSPFPLDANTVTVTCTGDSVRMVPFDLPFSITGGLQRISRNRGSDTLLISRPDRVQPVSFSRKLSVPFPMSKLAHFIRKYTGLKTVSFTQDSFPFQLSAPPLTLSHSFRELLEDIYTKSRNLSAEQSLRYSAIRAGFNGSFESFLSLASNPTRTGRFADGSGLSRYNLTSARELLPSLKVLAENKEIREAFAVYGLTGTLDDKNPVSDSSLTLFAKSGSMTGIQNLAGIFVQDQTVIGGFVLFRNNLIAGKQDRDLTESRFLRFVVNRLKKDR